MSPLDSSEQYDNMRITIKVQSAQDAQRWTEIVTEGGRRFMTEWRKEEGEKSKSRREKRTAK